MNPNFPKTSNFCSFQDITPLPTPSNSPKGGHTSTVGTNTENGKRAEAILQEFVDFNECTEASEVEEEEVFDEDISVGMSSSDSRENAGDIPEDTVKTNQNMNFCMPYPQYPPQSMPAPVGYLIPMTPPTLTHPYSSYAIPFPPPYNPEPIIIPKSKGKHTTRPKTFVCPVENCNQAFVRKQNLKSHLGCHSDQRPFPCDECDKAFRRRQELLRHKRSLHGGAETVIVRCPGCGKPFYRTDAYHRHLQSAKAKNLGCVDRHNHMMTIHAGISPFSHG